MMRWLAQLQNTLSFWLRNARCSHCNAPLSPELSFCMPCKRLLGFSTSAVQVMPSTKPVVAATLQTPAVKRLIYGYKFHRRGLNYTDVLADILKEAALWSANDSVWLTTIPKRPNSASRACEAIAKRLARRTGAVYCDNLLTWTRSTRQQHQLGSRAERLANMRNSLMLADDAWQAHSTRHLKAGCEAPTMLVIVDDLTTTGATLLEAYRAASNSPIVKAASTVIVPFAISQVPLFSTDALTNPELTDPWPTHLQPQTSLSANQS